MTRTIASIAEMKGFAREFLSTLAPQEGRATIVGLSGDLGSGKTAFVKCLAEALGVTEEVLSPTFVLAKFYDLKGQQWERIVHVDAYRIEDPKEIAVLDWERLCADSRVLLLVEWPEQLKERFPKDATMLHFLFVDETTRTVG